MFRALSQSVKTVNAKLEATKAQMQDLIHKVELAVQVGQAIDKAIHLAAKFCV